MFVDCCPDTYNISISDLAQKITNQTEAILAVHVFGVPADCLALEKLAKAHNIKLIFDAAHGMGSTLDNIKIGRFGDAEVFSTTPTKTLVTGEGGLIFTRDAALAQRLRTYREYGNPGDYDCTYVGTNGRLNEISCLMGVASFDLLPENIRLRNAAANAYTQRLKSVPGISLQHIPNNVLSTYKDFSIRVDKQLFGCDRDVLEAALCAEGIPTRRYFFPVVHKMKGYKEFNATVLPVSENIAANILCLPIYPLLPLNDIALISSAIAKIQRQAHRIANYIDGS